MQHVVKEILWCSGEEEDSSGLDLDLERQVVFRQGTTWGEKLQAKGMSQMRQETIRMSEQQFVRHSLGHRI